MKTVFSWLVAVGTMLASASAWAEDAYLLSNGTQSLNLGYYMNGKSLGEPVNVTVTNRPLGLAVIIR